jgi:hypothetical protein
MVEVGLRGGEFVEEMAGDDETAYLLSSHQAGHLPLCLDRSREIEMRFHPSRAVRQITADRGKLISIVKPCTLWVSSISTTKQCPTLRRINDEP